MCRYEIIISCWRCCEAEVVSMMADSQLSLAALHLASFQLHTWSVSSQSLLVCKATGVPQSSKHFLLCGHLAGYPYRRTYPEFIDAFWQLRPASRHKPDAAASTSALLADAGLQPGADYQLGHTKVRQWVWLKHVWLGRGSTGCTLALQDGVQYNYTFLLLGGTVCHSGTLCGCRLFAWTA